MLEMLKMPERLERLEIINSLKAFPAFQAFIAFQAFFMTLRQYLTTMIIGTTLCWISWAFVIFNTDPAESNLIVFGFFYLSFFLAFLGTTSILSFFGHRFFSRELLPMFRYVQKSFRDALIISGALVVLLFLQGMRVLNFWNFGAFILALLFIISFFFSTKRYKSNSIGG